MQSQTATFQQVSSGPGITVAEQKREILKASKSVRYFVNEYCWLKAPTETGEDRIVRFKLWKCQWDLLHTYDIERQVVILKARQLGVSWLTLAYALWDMTFHPGTEVLLFSKRDEEAMELVSRTVFMRDSLPPHLQPGVAKSNEHEFVFDNGSRIKAFPTTENTGRSYTGSLVIADEAAFIPKFDQLLAAVMPIVADGTAKLFVLSTANGVGNEYHRIWRDSIEGKSSFVNKFLGWFERPGRTQEWYARMKRDLKPWQLHQEYPGDPDEAFIQTGMPYFDLEDCTRRASVTVPIRETRDYQIFQDSIPGHTYLHGVDTSEGMSDHCSHEVIDAATGEEVAVRRGLWKPDVFASFVDTWARLYPGVLVIENNGPGQVVIAKCRELRTPGMYFERRKTGRIEWGWKTTTLSKPLMINELDAGLRDKSFKVASLWLYNELAVFSRDGGDGPLSAPEGEKDDCVIGAALAWQGRRRAGGAASIVSPPQQAVYS